MVDNGRLVETTTILATFPKIAESRDAICDDCFDGFREQRFGSLSVVGVSTERNLLLLRSTATNTVPAASEAVNCLNRRFLLERRDTVTTRTSSYAKVLLPFKTPSILVPFHVLLLACHEYIPLFLGPVIWALRNH